MIDTNPFSILEKKLHNIEVMIMDIKFSPQNSQSKPAEIISGEELCKKFDITPQTLIRWKQKGKIPFLQFGSVIRYDLNKVIEALEVKQKK